MLDDLQQLSQHLGMTEDEDALEVRPPTGGTSASVSTTAHGGSSNSQAMSASAGFDAVSECSEENLDEVEGALSDDPFDTLRGPQRAHYELQHATLPHGCRIETSPGSLGQLFLSVDVGEGPYTPSTLVFWIKIFGEYPARDSFSVRCTKKIFHPSVDPDTRHVDLQESQLIAAGEQLASGSRQGSTGVKEMRLQAMLVAIRNLVLRPVDSPAANADAAMLLQTDPDEFRRTVRSTMNGGEYRGVRFDKVLSLGKSSTTVVVDKPTAREMPDSLRMDLMKLEVMRDQWKKQANEFSEQNMIELRSLESS